MNGGLHAVYIGKPSERISNFWMVWFLKTESELNFGFAHIFSDNMLISGDLFKYHILSGDLSDVGAVGPEGEG